ncbi:MAG TPA: dienelactone hydrolase family protein [Chitinophagales bacterium]|nr:dienelactone hydrolase family protein [Chitinophagales bacterium]
MQTHSLEVKRTARIYTLGKLTPSTERIWIVLHGYSMLAEFFIKKFDHLDLEKNYIIAPEGLSRFYQNGMNGRVGASWMTSADRLNEIQDYIQYLNDVYRQFIEPNKKNRKVIALGFSQGNSTLFRWINANNYSFEKIISWGGTIPTDVIENYKINHHSISIYYGNQDPFFSQKDIDQYTTALNQHNIDFTLNKYEGGHTIIKEEITDDLISTS